MLPWAEMMRAAASLGIAPPAFWKLSLREWRHLTGVGGEMLGRRAFEQMMTTHPDKES